MCYHKKTKKTPKSQNAQHNPPCCNNASHTEMVLIKKTSKITTRTQHDAAWCETDQVRHLHLTWLQLWVVKTTQQKANWRQQMIRKNVMFRWEMIWSVARNVLTAPACSQSIRAWAVSEGSCDLRLSLSSWLGWSSRASLRSSANWTTCSGPALTGEPRSYMLLENSTAAAFEPEECVDEEERRETVTHHRAIINTITKNFNVTAVWSSSISCVTSQFARGPRMELWILLNIV